MIFRPELVAKIIAGEKTMTRRPVKPGQAECRYKPGVTYAVQPGRTKRAVALIKVTAVARQELGDITAADAIAEGFESRQAFLDYWCGLYQLAAPPLDRPVWALRFELVVADERVAA